MSTKTKAELDREEAAVKKAISSGLEIGHEPRAPKPEDVVKDVLGNKAVDPGPATKEEMKRKMRGFRKYELRAPHYRLGELHPTGTVVEVDAEEKPSTTWTKLVRTDPRHAIRLPPLPEPKTDEDEDEEDESIEASYR